jgi:hypothetical protein
MNSLAANFQSCIQQLQADVLAVLLGVTEGEVYFLALGDPAMLRCYLASEDGACTREDIVARIEVGILLFFFLNLVCECIFC